MRARVILYGPTLLYFYFGTSEPSGAEPSRVKEEEAIDFCMRFGWYFQ